MGNLPFSTTSDELAALFGRVGEVTSAQVITDRETGRSRGFGFVEMNDDDARRAIDELTGADVGGRSITVNEARPRQPRGDRGNYGGGGGGGGGYRRDDRGGGNYGGGGGGGGYRRDDRGGGNYGGGGGGGGSRRDDRGGGNYGGGGGGGRRDDRGGGNYGGGRRDDRSF